MASLEWETISWIVWRTVLVRGEAKQFEVGDSLRAA